MKALCLALLLVSGHALGQSSPVVFAINTTYTVPDGQTVLFQYDQGYGWTGGDFFTGPASIFCDDWRGQCRAVPTGGAQPAEPAASAAPTAIDYRNTSHLLQAVLVMGCAGTLWAGFRSGDRL